jgi:uncharacterized membrane protein YdjX (TVP38/TMEM64 family)
VIGRLFREYKDYVENVLGLVIIFAVIFVGFRYFDFAQIQAWIVRAGFWAPLVLILAKASTMVFAPISGSPLYPLSGALFGLPLGSLYLILGDMLGGTISFYLSRGLGRRAVERFARGNAPVIDRVVTFMETTKGFLVARVCFIALPEAVSYAAGLTRIKFGKFLPLFTLVGVVPTIILAGAGSWLAVSQDYFSTAVIIVVGLIAAAAGGVIFYRLTKPAPPSPPRDGAL